MTSEDVTVLVGSEVSFVTGSYTFTQGQDDWPYRKDTHVLIHVPVFEKRNSCARSAPKVSVNGVKIPEQKWRDLPLADTPSQEGIQIPKEFYMAVHQYVVPLKLIGRTFSVSITYEQDNFPGQIAAYLPIKPPPTRGQIIFKAAEGWSLKPFRARRFWHPSFGSLSFTPEDRKLIQVKCVEVKR